jgi:hypothetical protein
MATWRCTPVIKFIIRELAIADDFLKIYFWLVGIPYLIQYLTVNLMS